MYDVLLLNYLYSHSHPDKLFLLRNIRFLLNFNLFTHLNILISFLIKDYLYIFQPIIIK